MTRATALFLTVLTGFSGLVYEVAWQKYLAILLGSESEATAAVLAIFLGGLAAGYAIFGVATRLRVERALSRHESPRLLRFYGFVEGGVGVYALLFPFFFTGVQHISFWVPAGHEALSFGFDVFLTALLLVPPTILMGGTIPVLTQALSERVGESTRIHAWVYAFNTIGAFGGALAGGFWLIPWLGLDGVMRAMAVFNLVAGATFIGLQLREGAPAWTAGTSAAPAGGHVIVPRFGSLAAVALLSGFAMMSIQTVLNRIGAVSFGASQFTFSMVVAVFVLSIALGSFAVSALSRIPPVVVVASQWLLVALLVLLYLPMQDAPYFAHVVRALFRDIPQNFYPYYLTAFTGLLIVLVIPIGLSGALLPLLFHQLRQEIGDLGAVAGRLYSWNTVGSLLGALLGGYALLFWLDLHTIYALSVAALAVGAGILSVRIMRLPTLACGALTAAVLAGLVFLPVWQPARLASGTFRLRGATPTTFSGPSAFFRSVDRLPIVFYDDDPVQSVAVKQAKRRDGRLSRSIVNNGKSDGDLVIDYTTMGMVALLPALFTDDPSRVFVVGWGTGTTAGELASLDQVKHVTVAEISPGVIQAAPLFDFGNRDASRNPKVKLIRRDAYRALLHAKGKFGIIASEPSNPWVTGVEMLFSQDFLRAAKAHLTPGGVWAQWFHLYEIDQKTVDIALRTYASVFDHVAVWYTYGPDIVLLGYNSPHPDVDLARLHARFDRADFRAGFRRCKIQDFDELLAHEEIPVGVLTASRLPGPIHTLRHPILSYHAARAFFVGDTVPLPRFAPLDPEAPGAPKALLARYLRVDDGPLSDDVLAELTDHTCSMARMVECATMFGRWLHDHPDSPRLKEALAKFQADPQLQGVLEEKKLQDLAALYAGQVPPYLGAKDALGRAVETTQIILHFENYSVPFPRKALDVAWGGCFASGDPLDCENQRVRLEKRFIRFGPSEAESAGQTARAGGKAL